jgi:hypothetical protein
MTNPERRACRRFTVPHAVVDWTTDPPGDSYGSDARVGDLSRGGMRIVTPGPPPPGSILQMDLRIPGEPAVLLRGRVAWSAVSSGQIHDVGVEFAAYGPEPAQNPPAALDWLAEIERRFGDATG